MYLIIVSNHEHTKYLSSGRLKSFVANGIAITCISTPHALSYIKVGVWDSTKLLLHQSVIYRGKKKVLIVVS